MLEAVYAYGRNSTEVINSFSARTVFMRLNLTYNDDPRTEKIKIFIMAADP